MDAKGYAERVGELLRQRGLSLGIAESCTGGLVSDLVTDVPGSSTYLVGGIVAYGNRSKEQLLGVRGETLDAHGAVSASCAAEMAAGARRVLRADLGISITGIAGPGGGTVEKPVGLTFLHLSAPDAELGQRMIWQGDRRANKESSALAALQLLVAYLEQGVLSRNEERMGWQIHATTIDEPVFVQARFRPGGEVQPTAFVWRERTRYLAGVGRRWTEETDTGTWHCFLAQTVAGDTVELRWHATSHEWRLQRAWWRDALA